MGDWSCSGGSCGHTRMSMISGGLWLWVQQAMFEGVFLAVAPSLNSTTTCCQARYDEFQCPMPARGWNGYQWNDGMQVTPGKPERINGSSQRLEA